MKLLLFIGAVLFSLTSFAERMPVGTWASFDLAMIAEDGSKLTATEKVTVLEYSATEVLIETVQDQDGNVTVEKEWVPNDEIFSPEEGKMVVDQCTSPDIGGVVENVTAAGSVYPSCKLGDETADGAIWIGAVSFGALKMIAHGELSDDDGNVQKFTFTRDFTGSGH